MALQRQKGLTGHLIKPRRVTGRRWLNFFRAACLLQILIAAPIILIAYDITRIAPDHGFAEFIAVVGQVLLGLLLWWCLWEVALVVVSHYRPPLAGGLGVLQAVVWAFLWPSTGYLPVALFGYSIALMLAAVSLGCVVNVRILPPAAGAVEVIQDS